MIGEGEKQIGVLIEIKVILLPTYLPLFSGSGRAVRLKKMALSP